MDLLFDKDQFRNLMNDFYIITNIKIVFYDNAFQPVIAVPEEDCAFCSAMKQNPAALAKCEQCIQTEVQKCKDTNSLNIYKCHSGLIEAVAPLKLDDVIIGYIMFGQILDAENRPATEKAIIRYASQYSSSNIGQLLKGIAGKTEVQVRSVAKFMEACISYLIMHNLVQRDHTCSGLAFKIADYIQENLSSNLCVERLCAVFCISRSTLYKIFHAFFGMSVAKYIRKKRIDAVLSLMQTDIAVADAACQVGFDDYNYFSKVFKLETGISPSKYRRQSVKNVSVQR